MFVIILGFVFQGKFVFPLAWILKASINSGNVQPRILAFQCECDIQGVQGVKVTTSGFNSRADSESKTSYTHGSNS